VRFLYSGIGFNLALLGLTATTLNTVAAPVPPAITHQTSRLALYQSDFTVIKGNGVEFTLPAGFEGGSPTSSETKAMIAATAKAIPSIAPFVKVFDDNPTMLRAVAMNTNSQQSPSMVLITKLPVPANVSMEYLQELMAKSMPSLLPPEFKLVKNQLVNIGSRQVVQMSLNINMGSIKLQESIGLFKEGNDIYQVTYVYTTENTQQTSAVFEQILNTFKATPTTTVRTPII
jgi:hypothetical protein